jgi:hypothetical protein
MNNQDYILVYFDDEDPLLQAVRRLKENNLTIIDVLTPFPVHGIDKLLSIKRTRIPVGGFIFGVLGGTLAFWFMSWVFTVSYPLIIGGKPFFAVPSFVPITFEMTVLFAGLSMAAGMFLRSKLKPDIRFKPADERITDNMFIIVIGSGLNTTRESIRTILSGINIIEIR